VLIWKFCVCRLQVCIHPLTQVQHPCLHIILKQFFRPEVWTSIIPNFKATFLDIISIEQLNQNAVHEELSGGRNIFVYSLLYCSVFPSVSYFHHSWVPCETDFGISNRNLVQSFYCHTIPKAFFYVILSLKTTYFSTLGL